MDRGTGGGGPLPGAGLAVVEPAEVSPIKKGRKRAFEWNLECARCGYVWTSYAPTPPKRCARCKAKNFERPAYYSRKPK